MPENSSLTAPPDVEHKMVHNDVTHLLVRDEKIELVEDGAAK